MAKRNQFGKNNPYWKGGRAKCIDCGKLLSRYEKGRCRKCFGIQQKESFKGKLNPFYGKKHSLKTKKLIAMKAKKRLSDPTKNPRYIDGRTHNNKCKICGEHIVKGSKICKACFFSSMTGKGNPMYNKKGQKKDKLIKHHLNLNRKDNRKSNLMCLTLSQHTSLHQQAYRYLVETMQVKQYIKWFFKREG
jgi:hypothetical protein